MRNECRIRLIRSCSSDSSHFKLPVQGVTILEREIITILPREIVVIHLSIRSECTEAEGAWFHWVWQKDCVKSSE